MTQKLRVPEALDGLRLDVAIARLAPHVSRRAARRLVEDGAVSLDGKRVQVCSRAVRKDSTIEIADAPARPRDIPEVHDLRDTPHGPDAPAAALDGPDVPAAPHVDATHDARAPRIISIDSDLVVVDKPAGVPTEPTREGSRGTLLAALHDALRVRGENVTFLHATHRLDTHTTGIVVFARNKSAAHHVGRQLAEGAVERRYLALIAGVPTFQKARIALALTKSRDKDGRIRVDPDGSPAVTLATVLAPGTNAALALCAPRTGRTHQLRVHLKEAGHALIGDRVYAGTRAAHLGLHALSLAFTHPRGDDVRYAAAPPRSFVDAASERGIPGVVVESVARHLAPEMV